MLVSFERAQCLRLFPCWLRAGFLHCKFPEWNWPNTCKTLSSSFRCCFLQTSCFASGNASTLLSWLCRRILSTHFLTQSSLHRRISLRVGNTFWWLCWFLISSSKFHKTFHSNRWRPFWVVLCFLVCCWVSSKYDQSCLMNIVWLSQQYRSLMNQSHEIQVDLGNFVRRLS